MAAGGCCTQDFCERSEEKNDAGGTKTAAATQRHLISSPHSLVCAAEICALPIDNTMTSQQWWENPE